jgi:hypothetical protein
MVENAMSHFELGMWYVSKVIWFSDFEPVPNVILLVAMT